MEADKDSLISSIDNFLNDENLELYDINIVNFPTLSKIEIFVYSENNNKVTSRFFIGNNANMPWTRAF